MSPQTWARSLISLIVANILIVLVVLTIIGAIIWVNDPINVPPGGIRGVIDEDGRSFRLIVSVDKRRHCPGLWNVDIEGDDKFISTRVDVSPRRWLLPTGTLSNHMTPPIYLPQGVAPLDPGKPYSAVVTVLYQCGLIVSGHEPIHRRFQVPGVYHYEFTFTLQPASSMQGSDDELSLRQSRRKMT